MRQFIVMLGFVIVCSGCENRSISQWSVPRNIAPNLTGTSEKLSLAVDMVGNPHVAWAEHLESFIGDEIYYAYRRADGSWQAPLNVSQTPTPSYDPVLLTDGLGQLHLLWSEQRIGVPTPRPRQTDIFWRLRGDTGWTSPISIFQRDTVGTIPPAHIVSDSTGTLFVVVHAWSGRVGIPAIGLITRRSGSWQSVRALRIGLTPSIGIDSAGVLRIAYVIGIPDSIAPDINSVFTIYSTNGGLTWSDSVLVSRSGLAEAGYPRMVTDSFGRHHVIWFKSPPNQVLPRALYHSSSIDGIEWQPAINLTEGIDAFYTSFDCVADRYGRLHVVAQGVAQGNNRLYYFVFSNNSWSAGERIAGTPFMVALAVSPSGVLHLVWSDGDTTSRGVYHAERNIALSAPKDNTALPKTYSLSPSFPNPFNATTQIHFELPERVRVSLTIYDLLGRKVTVLVKEVREAGYHIASWNADGVASGMYFARFIATNVSGSVRYLKVSKLVLAK